MLSSRLSWITGSLSSLFLLFGSNAMFAADSALYRASGANIPLPSSQTPFSEYVATTQTYIQRVLEQFYFQEHEAPFGSAYRIDDVVDMRSPYQISPDEGCLATQAKLGFLLTHGLTDSPYLLRDISASLHTQYPCALIRGLLLPGHGTVPGDTLAMDYQDWLAITDYGVDSFRGEVDSLYMVGFSTGTSLSVRYVDAHRADELVKGLIMLSPAITASSGLAFLSPYLSWFRDWLSEGPESDPARYESFSVNAGAQFYQLTKDLTDAQFAPLTVPVFMAGSADDSTVNMSAAREFFCAKTPSNEGVMLWFQSEQSQTSDLAQCSTVQELQSAAPEYRVINLAHTSMSISAGNPHYGAQGQYRMCLQYGLASDDYWQCVRDDKQTVYGESGLGTDGRYDGNLIRRGSFNPHYDFMVEKIFKFIESTQ